jgi:hypothetical protein
MVAAGCDHAYPTTNQFGRHHRQAIVPILRPTVFDRHILAFDVASFFQAKAERAHNVGELV